MALFSIEIDDDYTQTVLDAVASNYGRPDQVQNAEYDESRPITLNNSPTIDNPETKAEFANRIVREFLEENALAYEIKKARLDAEKKVKENKSIGKIKNPHV